MNAKDKAQSATVKPAIKADAIKAEHFEGLADGESRHVVVDGVDYYCDVVRATITYDGFI